MIKIYKTLFLLLFISSLLFSNIIYETGSLKEFIAGECPTCAYDNFINHTSEGIAQEGYNIYAPDWIDVQNNGF